MLGNLFKDLPRDSFLIETKVKPEGVGQNGLPTSKTTTDDFLSKIQHQPFKAEAGLRRYPPCSRCQ
jgi:hypothetical protein